MSARPKISWEPPLLKSSLPRPVVVVHPVDGKVVVAPKIVIKRTAKENVRFWASQAEDVGTLAAPVDVGRAPNTKDVPGLNKKGGRIETLKRDDYVKQSRRYGG
jgi:hypothetical protein